MDTSATPTFTADLGVREANYCFKHFLDAASRYYSAALPACHEALARAAHLRNEHVPASTTPSRVQPPRRVKRRSAPAEETRRSQVIKRRVRNLLAGMPIPTEGRRLMSEDEWRVKVKAVAERAITEKVVWRYRDGPAPCTFGPRTWKCGVCEDECWQGNPERAYGVVPTARMERVVGGEGGEEQPGGWWGVKIPEAEVVRFGGLRFVVDVCGHSLVMFV